MNQISWMPRKMTIHDPSFYADIRGNEVFLRTQNHTIDLCEKAFLKEVKEGRICMNPPSVEGQMSKALSLKQIEKIINQVRWMVGKEAILGEKINTNQSSKILAQAIYDAQPDIQEMSEEKILDILPNYFHTITVHGEGEPNIPHQQVIFKKDIPELAKEICSHFSPKKSIKSVEELNVRKSQ